MTVLWLGFVGLIVALVLLDLFVFNRPGRAVSGPAAVAWGTTYALLGFIFAFAVYFMYQDNWMGLGRAGEHHPTVGGLEAWRKFVLALVMQTALGLDSVFVVAAVFEYFKTPEAARRRVLFWGVPIAMGVQGLLIWAVGGLFEFTWARVFLSVLLLLAALRMLLIRQENPDPSRNLIVRLLRVFVPVTPGGRDEGPSPTMVRVVNGQVAITPLVIALVVFETFDGVFALDAIPAVFAITRDPFIVFTAAAFSLLILRSVYLVLRALHGWVRYVKVGMALVLGYAAVLMSLPPDWPMPTGVSMIVVGSTLAAATLLAWIFARPGEVAGTTSPLGPEADELARTTLRQARKVQTLVVGGTIVIAGAFMLIGPGPGLLVIPVGLAMLATEFAWAKRLLERYTVHAERAIRVAGGIAVKKPRVHLVPPVIGFVLGLFLSTMILAPVPRHWVLAVATPVLVFTGMWAWTNYLRQQEVEEAERAAREAGVGSAPDGVNAAGPQGGRPPA